MAKDLDPKLKAVLEEELGSLKESHDKLASEREELLSENRSLKGEVKNLRESVRTLGERNSRLLREARSISRRAKVAVDSARSESAKEKRRFVDSASSRLEDHINRITESAFASAKKLFEQDFSEMESSLLKELGRLLSPYLSDSGAVEKIKKLKDTLGETKQAYTRKLAALERENVASDRRVDALASELDAAKVSLSEAKFELYKNALVDKLPSSLRDKAKKRLVEAASVSDARKVYFDVLNSKEADNPEAAPKPGVDKKRPKDSAVITEVATGADGEPDWDDINNPELLRKAGILKDY